MCDIKFPVTSTATLKVDTNCLLSKVRIHTCTGYSNQPTYSKILKIYLILCLLASALTLVDAISLKQVNHISIRLECKNPPQNVRFVFKKTNIYELFEDLLRQRLIFLVILLYYIAW